MQKNPSGGTLGILLAYGNCQVSLSFLDGFEERFGYAQGYRTNILKRPEAFQYHRDADYRQHNQGIRGNGAFMNDVDKIQTLLLHESILPKSPEDYLKRKLIQ
jgi:hypothetical protein